MKKERGEGSPLFVFEESEIITPDQIDYNGHMNNAEYLKVYQRQRAHYLEAIAGMSVEDAINEFGVMPVVYEYGGRFIDELLVGDVVTISTAADASRRSSLRFDQQMTRGGKLVSEFWCTVPFMNNERRLARVPHEVQQLIQRKNQGFT